VLSTVGVAAGINGPTRPAILSELPGLQVLDRTTMNAFEDRAFREAVKKTGRQRLIFGGLHTEISPLCLNIRVAVIGLMMGHVATIGLPHEDRTWRADRCLSAGETL